MISVRNVCHTYNPKSNQEILHHVSMDIPDGKFVLLLGQSGSGKTTLLNIIAGLMKPTSGTVISEGESLYEKTTAQLCDYRSKHVGFVFQNYFLENCFTAGENVMIPLLLNCQLRNEERERRVKEVLGQVGLAEKLSCKPTELSGGECQRISIARALVNEPKFIIADEPTGNLDSVNGNKIIDILRNQTEKQKTVLMVTHNERYIPYADLVFRICDGVVQ